MTIETKYDVGDEVWVYIGGKPKKRKVGRIETNTIGNFQRIVYYLNNEIHKPTIFHEYQLFPTKEELLKSS